MAVLQPLNAYFSRKALQKVELKDAYREKIEQILRLYKYKEVQVKVSAVFRELYPELSDASANRALSRLAQHINECANAQGVKLVMMVSTSKGTDKRAVWFEGPAAEPNLANFDDLKGVPPKRLVETQGIFMDREGGQELVTHDALKDWAVRADSPQFFALLGEHGTGKTVACQRLAKELGALRTQDANTPLPLYFDLRHVTGLDKGLPTLAEILEECMERGWIDQNGEARFTLERLYQSMEAQPALVIFDGLDEALVKLSEADGQAFTRTLYKVAEDIEARRKSKKIRDIPPLKILISCRTHFFRTLREQKNHFIGQVDKEPFITMLLLPLEASQVERYLQSAFPKIDAHKLLETIRSIHNLTELSHRPITLKYIADYLPEIEADRATGKTIQSVALYEKIVMRWLERDVGKHHIHPKHKMPMAMHLAAYLWQEGSGALEIHKLEDWLSAWLRSNRDIEWRYRNTHPDQREEDLRTTNFLVREDVQAAENARFRFAHPSLLEFFLAKYLLGAIEEDKPERWQIKEPSRETLDFLGQMLALSENRATLLHTLNAWGQTRREQVNERLLRDVLLAQEKAHP
jgi:hypothetical protein